MHRNIFLAYRSRITQALPSVYLTSGALWSAHLINTLSLLNSRRDDTSSCFMWNLGFFWLINFNSPYVAVVFSPKWKAFRILGKCLLYCTGNGAGKFLCVSCLDKFNLLRDRIYLFVFYKWTMFSRKFSLTILRYVLHKINIFVIILLCQW